MPELPGQADVVIAGAGLAGLAAARVLTGAGLEVVLIDPADAPGGRVRTDRRDGLLLDRGFQLLNPAYPEARRMLDLGRLDLRSFAPGLVVASGSGRSVLADPLRRPGALLGDLRAPFGSAAEKLALARWAARIGYGPAQRIKERPDSALGAELTRLGISGELRRRVIEPFLAGVLAESGLSTSRRLGELLVRAFVRGRPALPAGGMQAIPDQLAARLPTGVLHLNTALLSAGAGIAHTDAGTVRAPALVIACDPVTACRLAGLPQPAMRALTTFYHRSQEPPSPLELLHLDGDAAGPLVNTAVVSNVAPTYAASGSLIASTILGADDSAAMEATVRAQAARVYGADPRGWTYVGSYPIAGALPAMPPPLRLRKPVALGDGVYVCGDHRDTASIQGALVSGRRTALAVLADLRAPQPGTAPPGRPAAG
ncbi:MAG TPA: NAD(P)/FAD-dependent oxidoreductase [Streptosporangiaceae bacterium]